ncbi:MAG: DUF4956 domain-containing protein [Gammaproteobacteria bacterium]|nr:DUF4956 domain-containing protein [Gammaproteobacteria bacterium]MCP4090710.1 DUF4956 domain-containing protein [Gammaproteobacteria bacterium]MCP4277137.1 DUF4956 domain-containing protein [Gammaproteobacteria bacterium]MCP4832693.1 DUF4956 domain-containing protein [Gammaproteobacteria bacterium]MCP4928053.1 DUF4956 domain-containing protein [Gammaproteobacteria bacterium]
MPQELEIFGASGDAPFSSTELILNLAIGLVLAVILRWHFLRFGSTLSNRDELGGVLPFILLTTILIITVVKTSLALSLGLVGALSIVRFRTPIKEPEELAYLFIAIAIGLGLGANQALPTTLAATFILLAMSLIKRFTRRESAKNLYLSVSLSGQQSGQSQLDSINELLGQHVVSSDLRRFDERSGGLEATYLLDINSTGVLTALSNDLRAQFPEIGITFLDQNGMPGI